MIALKVEHKEIKNMEFGRIRVYIQRGNQPVIFVAPHGVDDLNTDEIVKAAADELDAYAVINQGFMRSKTVDVQSDKADCNKIDHVIQDVVKEEFLDPILNFKKEIERMSAFQDLKLISPLTPHKSSSIEEIPSEQNPLIVIVHGAGNHVHKIVNDTVSCVVGCGRGTYTDSIICKEWRMNLFIEVFRHYFTEGDIYLGKASGKYAARKKNNIAQYFKLYKKNHKVDVLQLEFPPFLRKNKWESVNTGLNLANVVRDVLLCDSYDSTVYIEEI